MPWRWALLPAVLAAAGGAAAQNTVDDIVVVGPRELVIIGRSLKKVHLRYELNGPYLRECTIVKSSGDRRADDTACMLLGRCINLGYREEEPARQCLERGIEIFADRARRKLDATAQ